MNFIKRYAITIATIACLIIGFLAPSSNLSYVALVPVWFFVVLAVTFFMISAVICAKLKRGDDSNGVTIKAAHDMLELAEKEKRRPVWVTWTISISIAALLGLNGFVASAVIYLLSAVMIKLCMECIKHVLQELDEQQEQENAPV